MASPVIQGPGLAHFREGCVAALNCRCPVSPADGVNIDVDLTVQVLRVACQGLISAAVVQPSGLKVNYALVERIIRMLTRDLE